LTWEKHLENSWFRSGDLSYAGKDHTKSNKTFICIFYDEIEGLDIEKGGFKTLLAAKNYVDINCPQK
jgi:hypothetical protein